MKGFDENVNRNCQLNMRRGGISKDKRQKKITKIL